MRKGYIILGVVAFLTATLTGLAMGVTKYVGFANVYYYDFGSMESAYFNCQFPKVTPREATCAIILSTGYYYRTIGGFYFSLPIGTKTYTIVK